MESEHPLNANVAVPGLEETRSEASEVSVVWGGGRCGGRVGTEHSFGGRVGLASYTGGGPAD